MIEIGTYSTCDKESVIALVLHCQNDGTRPLVGVEDQSDLLHIEEEYIYDGGNFGWQRKNGKVAGTIGLMNKGNGLCIIEKNSLCTEPYRGKTRIKPSDSSCTVCFWSLRNYMVFQG